MFGQLLKESGIGFKLCNIAFPSTTWTASDGLFVTSSIPDSRLWRSVDLSVLVGMPSAVARDQGTGPRGNDSVSSRSTSC